MTRTIGMGGFVARLGYGLLFCAGLPLLLVAWTRRLDAATDLPRFHVPALGIALTALGLGLVAWSMAALWRFGGGLPMNAFPPPHHVRRGPYRAVDHPIYLGFVIGCFGVAIALGSPAALWIVAPTVALGAAALVLGHEAHDLDRRFGRDRPRPWLTLPPPDDGPPGRREWISAVALVLVPWLVVHEMVGHLPVPDAFDVRLAFERSWPVIEWTALPYASVYPIVVLAPLLARDRRDVRRFMTVGWTATVLGSLAYLLIPAIAPPREFEPQTALGHLLLLEQADGLAGRAAMPSFHVFWTLLAAWTIAGRARLIWVRVLIASWAIGAVAACVTTGMNALVDIAGGALLFAIAMAAPRIWESIRRGAEWLANSWRAWHLGLGPCAPVRIINHGLFAGAGAGVGVLIAGAVAGPDRLGWIVALMLTSLLGAALWGQAVVGKPTSARPFGYFGSVVAIGIVTSAAWLLGASPLAVATACALAAPWVQAIGRLRCLVQGCCHGAPTPPDLHWLGIRCRNPQSRVCRLSALGDVPIHPTPVYSALANVVIGLLLARLHIVGAPATLVLGGYFLLAGIARFVEESFRGEPHTPFIGGLRLYQWLAIAMALIGIAITMAPSPAVDWPPIRMTPWLAAAALFAALLHFVAMGVDWPTSARRFARLA